MIKGANFKISATNTGGPALRSFSNGLRGVNKAQRAVVRSNVGFMRGMTANRRIIQNVGFQISDLGVQIAGGQSAILSLTQNVPQVVQMFGAWGAMMAALITIFGTLTIIMIKSGKSFSDIAPILGIAREEMQAVGRVVNNLKEGFFDALNAIINNLDMLLIALSFVVAFMIGKWIKAFLRSSGVTRVFNLTLVATRRHGIRAGAAMLFTRGAVVGLTKAMVLLKKALIATGIGALIVGSVILTERIITLQSVTESWGRTFSLIGNLVKQTFFALPMFAQAASLMVIGAMENMTASFLTFLAVTLGKMPSWVNSIVAGMVAVKNGTQTAWSFLPAIIGNIMAQTANAVLVITAKLVKDTVGGFGALISLIKPGSTLGAALSGFADNFRLDELPNKFAGAGEEAGAAIKAAIDKALGGTFVGIGGSLVDKALGDASDARGRAAQFKKMGDALFAGAKDAIPAWKEIVDLLDQAKVGDFDIRKIIDAMKKGTDAVKDNIKESMSFIQDLGKTIGDTIREGIKGLVKGTATLKDVLGNILNAITDKMIDFLTSALFKRFASFLHGSGPRDGGLGGLGGVFKGLGKFFGQNVKGAKALGGPTIAGNTYLVGEKGPELFTSAVSGKIIPNSSLKSVTRGGGSVSGGKTSVQLVVKPTPYFDAVVDERATGVAVPIAGVATSAGIDHFARASGRRNRQRLV